MDDAEARKYQPRIVFVDADNRQVDVGADAAYVPDAFGLVSPR
jgi:aspartate 1-decarboxylase